MYDVKRLTPEPSKKTRLTLNKDNEPSGDNFLPERPDLFKIKEMIHMLGWRPIRTAEAYHRRTASE